MVSEDPSAHDRLTLDSIFDTGVPPSRRLGGGGRRRSPGRSLKSRPSVSDLAFRAIAGVGGSLVLVLEILIGAFLAYSAWPALHKAGWSFLTTQSWNAEGGAFGIAAVVVGTALIGLVAVVVAVPLALGTSLYISEYAPKPVQRLLIGLLDLMAAVPSVVFGLWGSYLLQWRILPVSRWINDWFYWVPLFQVDGIQRSNPLTSLDVYSASTFIAGIVVGLMITPIIGSIMREAFGQAPAGEREGAYALGSTRWAMIRAVVLPFGRGAMIGGTMLGLGRALGETMAVLLIISPVYHIQPHILQSGTSSVSSLIALEFSESDHFGISALMAAGLALFAITLLVNLLAAQIVARSRSGAASD
ncbi:MAG TPA: phosphate ABC transporter permease subunit PstC [Streptosporangiaceae bacterium]